MVVECLDLFNASIVTFQFYTVHCISAQFVSVFCSFMSLIDDMTGTLHG
jgi:hypothetical protein